MDKQQQHGDWKRGLPPGEATPEAVRKYEVYFSPGGWTWYRERPTCKCDLEGPRFFVPCSRDSSA